MLRKKGKERAGKQQCSSIRPQIMVTYVYTMHIFIFGFCLILHFLDVIFGAVVNRIFVSVTRAQAIWAVVNFFAPWDAHWDWVGASWRSIADMWWSSRDAIRDWG